MTLAVIVLVVGLILFFVPSSPPAAPAPWSPAGKVNAVGWILIFWGVYLVVAALGVSVRLLR